MKYLTILLLSLHVIIVQAQVDSFDIEPLTCGLSQPWEITYGPDGALWCTESRAYRLIKIDPITGDTTLVLDAGSYKNWGPDQYPWPQGGFTGLALHPEFMTGKPYVYLAYVNQFFGCPGNGLGCDFYSKIERYSYDFDNNTLYAPLAMAIDLPGSDDHNGGRLKILLEDGDPYLFYTIGDLGSGQFGNENRPHHGQDPQILEGKILRLNLEQDDDSDYFESWIPNDNPFGNAVWTLGHRNPQGLAQHANGTIYAAEHGPYSDDEINILRKAGNYGHPLIAGYADGNYNGLKVGTGAVLPFIANEMFNADSIGSSYSDPLRSFYPTSRDSVEEIYQYVLSGTEPFPNYYLSWPGIAPSGLVYYDSDSIPDWKHSLLLATLKRAEIYRIQLSEDGNSVIKDTILPAFTGMGRFRDIAIDPDGKTLYIACDSVGQTSGPTNGTSLVPANRGCILKCTYVPPVDTMVIIGVQDADHPAITLYPNPVVQGQMISFEGVFPARATLFVYQADGRLVRQEVIHTPEFSTEGLPKGHYQVVLSDDQNRPMGHWNVLLE